MLPIATDVIAAMCGPSVCVSVTLVHPAKAVGQNKTPFGRHTRAEPSNTVLDRGLGPQRKGDFGVGTPDLYSKAKPVIERGDAA